MDFRDIKEFIKDTFSYITIFAVVLFVLVYVAGLQQVVGPSMDPTFKDGDVLMLNKSAYRFFDVKRFDIISFQYDGTKYLIKRVIGLPGETIKIEDNDLYIDGELIEQDFLDDEVITTDFNLSKLGYDEIPDDMYFVMGDNRENSLDSREIGLVEKADINGKTILRIWPLSKLKIY